MRLDFKIGKKFRASTGHIYECQWTNGRYGLMWLEGYTPVLTTGDDWVEYVEPIKSIEYVYRSKSDNRLVVLSHNYVDKGKFEFVSVIELTYDIHNGLSVEVIPGIG